MLSTTNPVSPLIWEGGGTINDVKSDGSFDADSGANNLQHFPVVTRVSFGPGAKTIEWTLNSAPDSYYTIEYFSSTNQTRTGFG